jgi:hypothetical protein
MIKKLLSATAALTSCVCQIKNARKQSNEFFIPTKKISWPAKLTHPKKIGPVWFPRKNDLFPFVPCEFSRGSFSCFLVHMLSWSIFILEKKLL